MSVPLYSKEDIQRIQQKNPLLFEDPRPRTTIVHLPDDLAIKLSLTTTAVPARIYSGDTPLHIDQDRVTSRDFTAAMLIYLTPSPGELVIGDISYPLDVPGTLYTIPSGTLHGTRNTENTPRISIGPFNEFGHAVGVEPSESGFNYYDIDNTTILYFDQQPVDELYTIKSFTDPLIGGTVPTGQKFVGWTRAPFTTEVSFVAGDYSKYLVDPVIIKNLYPFFVTPPPSSIRTINPSLRTISSANVVGDSSIETLSRAGMALVQARRQDPTMRFPDHASYLRYQQGRARIQIRRQAESQSIRVIPTIPSAPAITDYDLQGNEYNKGLLQINFSAPTNDGGSPILYYTIRAITSVSGPDILNNIQLSSYIFPLFNFITISPLSVNIPYTFKLSATNATGTSPWSSEFGPITIPPSLNYNAMLFDGTTAESYVKYPNDSSLAIGIQDFTIEWYQYWQSGGGDYPRPFSIGSFPNGSFPPASIAVSYEGTFYVWINGSANSIGDEPPKNIWTHISLVGTSGEMIKVYVNGSLLSTISTSYNFTDSTSSLTIGNETEANPTAAFKGKITNFRWIVGTAVYTTNFTPPIVPLENITGTQLLLLTVDSENVTKDSSSSERPPITGTGVTFSPA